MSGMGAGYGNMGMGAGGLGGKGGAYGFNPASMNMFSQMGYPMAGMAGMNNMSGYGAGYAGGGQCQYQGGLGRGNGGSGGGNGGRCPLLKFLSIDIELIYCTAIITI